MPPRWWRNGKGQWQIEHRHRDAKGPLRIRPLFVTSNRRIVGLVTILGLALMVFSLIERDVRRALAPDEKVPNLLAGHVAARPTGDNLFKALREIALVTFEIAGVRQPAIEDPRQVVGPFPDAGCDLQHPGTVGRPERPEL